MEVLGRRAGLCRDEQHGRGLRLARHADEQERRCDFGLLVSTTLASAEPLRLAYTTVAYASSRGAALTVQLVRIQP